MKNFKYTINGTDYNVVVQSFDDTTAEIEVNGKAYKVGLEEKQEEEVKRPVVRTGASPSAPKTTAAGAIKSPLPGVILSVDCKVGDTIEKGQKVIVLEAMKMENVITADQAGTVKSVSVNAGDSVMEGDILVVIG